MRRYSSARAVTGSLPKRVSQSNESSKRMITHNRRSEPIVGLERTIMELKQADRKMGLTAQERDTLINLTHYINGMWNSRFPAV